MNWGIKLMIAMICFIIFILGMVFYMIGKTDALVSNDYYEQDVRYQQVIQAKENLQKLHSNIETIYQRENNRLLIKFPSQLNMQKAKGKIQCMKLSDATQDFSTDLQISPQNEQTITLPENRMGSWKIMIRWKIENMPYQFEKELVIN
jgi:hypothetical protein